MSTLKKMLIGASGITLVAVLGVLAHKFGYLPSVNEIRNFVSMNDDDYDESPVVPELPVDSPPFRQRRRPYVESLDTTSPESESETEKKNDNNKYHIVPFNYRLRRKRLRRSAKKDPDAHLELEADLIDPDNRLHLPWGRYSRAPAIGVSQERRKLDDQTRIDELFRKVKKSEKGKEIRKPVDDAEREKTKREIGALFKELEQQQKRAQEIVREGNERQQKGLSELADMINGTDQYALPDGTLMPKPNNISSESIVRPVKKSSDSDSDISDREKQKRIRRLNYLKFQEPDDVLDGDDYVKENMKKFINRRSRPSYTQNDFDLENEELKKYNEDVAKKSQRFDFNLRNNPLLLKTDSDEGPRFAPSSASVRPSKSTKRRERRRKLEHSLRSLSDKQLEEYMNKQSRKQKLDFILRNTERTDEPESESDEDQNAVSGSGKPDINEKDMKNIYMELLETPIYVLKKIVKASIPIVSSIALSVITKKLTDLATSKAINYFGGNIREPQIPKQISVQQIPVQQNISNEDKKKIILDMFKVPIEVLKSIASATIPVISTIAIFVLTKKLKTAIDNYIDEYDYGNQQEGVSRFPQFPDPDPRHVSSAAGKYTPKEIREPSIIIPKPEIIKIEKELKKTPIEILKKIIKYAVPAIAVIASGILIGRLASISDADQQRINDNFRILFDNDDDFDYDGDDLIGTGKNDPKTVQKIKEVFDDLMNNSLESLKYMAKYAGGFLARVALAVIVAKISGKLGFNHNEITDLVRSVNY